MHLGRLRAKPKCERICTQGDYTRRLETETQNGAYAGTMPLAVRFREIGTGISEPSERVPSFPFATQGGKQASSYFRQCLLSIPTRFLQLEVILGFLVGTFLIPEVGWVRHFHDDPRPRGASLAFA